MTETNSPVFLSDRTVSDRPPTSGSGGGRAALPACTWETTETKFIAALQDLAKKSEQISQEVTKGIQQARATLEQWKNSVVGQMIGPAMEFINLVLIQMEITVQTINMTIQLINWVLPKLMAPWTIRSIGRSMQGPFVKKVNVFSESLSVSHTESQKSWHSPAGEAWRERAQEQLTEGGKPTVEATKQFADETTKLGDRAVAACENLVSDLTGGVTDIIEAVRDLKSVTKLLPKLVKGAAAAIKIITLIYDIVKFAAEVSDSADDFTKAVEGPMSTKWPNAAAL